ncbi:MAG: 1-acyl-sn-glycerol-3-phosphate acyltransferase [Chloroflexi bacterium]|nr:1-acyl-sn-glycerol-3-phosphate acyltransferase [Chloroflexota bacterium]
MFAYRHFVFLQTITAFLRNLGVLKWKVVGKEALPHEGTPFVMIVNHVKWHDILVVAGTVPLTHIPYWLAKSELFKPVLGWWLRSMQAIAVKRGQSDTAALDAAVDTLKNNNIMIVFPEGHRSGNGKLQKGRGGAVRMAVRAGVPIVPVAICGVEKGIGAPITITYGKPWQPVSKSGVLNIDPDEMTALTDEMMCHIAEMLPVEYHGYYADMMKTRATND